MQAAFAGTMLLLAVAAQSRDSVPWVWADGAQSGKAWFRREVKAHEPSTGFVRIAADRAFTAWCNGQKLGSGDASRFHRFTLNGIAERGTNVFAIEVAGGEHAGLWVEGEIRGQGGGRIPFDTREGWLATRTAPDAAWLVHGFNVGAAWKPATTIAKHADSPWKHLRKTEERFEPASGFEVKQIADHRLTGSLVCMTWGYKGRLIVSRERGPILNLTDKNKDGVYDTAEVCSDKVTNCQGLCMVHNDLYAVGDGPSGAGIYRLPDNDRDGKADRVELVSQAEGGMGEHGPHDIIYGPDGHLYFNHGNHAGVPHQPQPNSPIRDWYEGDLLRPRYEDGGGHAVGIKAPAGSIWRFSPDGKKWWLETAGFRNHYDFAINSRGDVFTFDSDMEWDVGQPWYRPVRVNHCIPGADFGWRSGTANWPEYYFDSLPTTVDIGRGSPCGVLFYEHDAIPNMAGKFLLCDWSMGRIIAVGLKPKGASYVGEFQTLVTGNPLNVSDIEVAEDGAIVFCTGGRNTEGGVYQITNRQPTRSKVGRSGVDAPEMDLPASVSFALKARQLSATWSREEVDAHKETARDLWAPTLKQYALQGGNSGQRIRALTLLTQFGPKPTAELLMQCAQEKHSDVRQFSVWLLGDHPKPEVAAALTKLLDDQDAMVRRRACEAFVRSGLKPPAEALIKLLGCEDNWLRFAARLALERVPAKEWRGQILSSTEPRILVNGLLTLHHVGKLPSDIAFAKELSLLKQDLPPGLLLDVLRMTQLTIIASGSSPQTQEIGRLLLDKYPHADWRVDYEAARLLAWLQVPGAGEKIFADLMGHSKDTMRQQHMALCLSYLKVGWTPAMKSGLVAWFDTTRDWEGGNSIAQNLENIFGGCLKRFSADELAKVISDYQRHPYAARSALRQTSAERLGGMVRVLERLLLELDSPGGVAHRGELMPALLDALNRSPTPEVQGLLRKLYDTQPDRRDLLARAMARSPRPENFSYLVASVRTGDETTQQECLRGLAKIDAKGEKPEDVRAVIVAGLRLRNRGAIAAANVLQRWTGSDHNSGRDWRKALTHYQAWFKQKFPSERPAELPKEDPAKQGYTYAQLVAFLDRDPRGQAGDVVRGKAVYAKTNCVKCHRFGKEGDNVGPDLTSVRRRFQRKEIVESIVNPSVVLSDQYKTLTVATVSGLVYNGMQLPQSDANKLVLLLSDATRVELPQSDVESRNESKVSVMPDSLLKGLTLQEVADLFAYLETSKDAPIEPAPAAGNGKTLGK